MAKKFQITVIEKGAMPKGMAGKFRRWLKEGWFALAKHWHEKYRPLHFSEAAFSRYGYMRRSSRYSRRKEKIHGHRRPLVFSGETLRRSEVQNIKGTSAGARVVMNVPTLNFKGAYKFVNEGGGLAVRWSGPRMNMRAELQTVNAQEVRGLEKRMRAHFNEVVRAEQQRRIEAKLQG